MSRVATRRTVELGMAKPLPGARLSSRTLPALMRSLPTVGQRKAADLVAVPPRPALTDERQRCAPARPAPWLEAIGKLAQGGRQLGERCPWHATTVCRAMQRGERAWRSADTGSLRGGLAQIRQHGEHAAVLGRRRPEPELVEDARHVLLDGRVAEDEGLGDALVGHALGHRRQDLALARAEVVERPRGAAAAQHAAYHLGVERAAAGGDPADSVDEGVDIADAFLEQVADALRSFADELERVLLLDVMREEEDAGLRTLASELERCTQSVVAAAGRHLDVGDHDVGAVRQRLAQEVLRIACLSADVEARFVEQPN